LSWLVLNGEIPDGFEACHKCDQPDCLNTRHLFLGTHHENMRDAKNKGRMITACGTAHYCCSFSESQVIDLRKKFSNGLLVTKSLALKYRVSVAALNKIKKFKSWKHIK